MGLDEAHGGGIRHRRAGPRRRGRHAGGFAAAPLARRVVGTAARSWAARPLRRWADSGMERADPGRRTWDRAMGVIVRWFAAAALVLGALYVTLFRGPPDRKSTRLNSSH